MRIAVPPVTGRPSDSPILWEWWSNSAFRARLLWARSNFNERGLGCTKKIDGCGMMSRMTNAAIQKRLDRLQAEIKLIRRSTRKRLDLSVDEKNWKKMRGTVKKVRAQLYKERYA